MKNNKLFFLSALVFSLFSASTVFAKGDLAEKKWENGIQKNKEYYSLNDHYSKKVDNTGQGFKPLTGIRNFRVVLHGILYRSGANNVYRETDKRDNKNPLPPEGLKSLCERDFSQAIYLYKTNFSSAEKQISCETENKEQNTLTYSQISALDAKNENQFLEIIYNHIQKKETKPILVHCWNGWHASGLVSTLALRQFCGLGPNEAVDYWIKNTDGNNKGYEKIKKRIANFQIVEKYRISDATMKTICPVMGKVSK